MLRCPKCGGSIRQSDEYHQLPYCLQCSTEIIIAYFPDPTILGYLKRLATLHKVAVPVMVRHVLTEMHRDYPFPKERDIEAEADAERSPKPLPLCKRCGKIKKSRKGDYCISCGKKGHKKGKEAYLELRSRGAVTGW